MLPASQDGERSSLVGRHGERGDPCGGGIRCITSDDTKARTSK